VVQSNTGPRVFAGSSRLCRSLLLLWWFDRSGRLVAGSPIGHESRRKGMLPQDHFDSMLWVDFG